MSEQVRNGLWLVGTILFFLVLTFIYNQWFR